MTAYEIYALKYAGPFKSSGAFLMWFKEWERVVERNYYIWCLKGKNETVVMDAGDAPELAADKNLRDTTAPLMFWPAWVSGPMRSGTLSSATSIGIMPAV